MGQCEIQETPPLTPPPPTAAGRGGGRAPLVLLLIKLRSQWSIVFLQVLTIPFIMVITLMKLTY